jgi:hypothetical protein
VKPDSARVSATRHGATATKGMGPVTDTAIVVRGPQPNC